MKYTTTKASDIKRSWHLIDIKGKILGRISTRIAELLMGKSKPYFVRHLDTGDNVVVVNAKHVKVSGKKNTSKKYYRHSGYPHGFRVETFQELKDGNPQKIIYHSVRGMLPQNRLRDKMLKRLHIFSESDHSYQEKFKEENNTYGKN